MRTMRAFVAVGAVLAAELTHAQCEPQWLAGQGAPGIGGTSVNATTLWDPDGPGPLPELLVVGGDFSTAGGVPAANIAAWTGSSWQALGSGVNGPVWDLEVFGGELIAAGSFTAAGGASASKVARWNGSTWQPMGQGIGGSQFVRVIDLHVFQGGLIAAGDFSPSNGALFNSLAQWNGSAWEQVAGSPNGAVNALMTHNSELVAGGMFTQAGGQFTLNTARWNGTSWSALAGGLGTTTNQVTALGVFGGSLYAGGIFPFPSTNVARWDGAAWQPAGSGVPNLVTRRFAVYAGELFAAGDNSATGVCIQRWNGVSWTGVGAGAPGPISALQVYGTQLVAGGSFLTAGGTAAQRLATWNGAAWRPFGETGFNNEVLALAPIGGDLIAGGKFGIAPGGVNAGRIARFDGVAWHPFGAGLASSETARVRCIAEYNGDLFAGGAFSVSGGNNLARWNGTSWQGMGSFTFAFAPPSWIPTFAAALIVFENRLVVGGHFNRFNNDPAFNNMARWDGVSWDPIGSGFLGYAVNALAIYEGQLVAGTQETYPTGGGGTVVRWNGTSWTTLGTMPPQCGGCTSGQVAALQVYGNELIVGGDFAFAGTTATLGIARWDGASWLSFNDPGLNSGPFGGGGACAFANYRGDLVVGGSFWDAGFTPASNIARRHDQAWHALGSGTSSMVSALALFRGDLYVGGGFTTAGGVPSPYLARWGCPCYADCNNSSSLTIADFGCFQTQFAQGHAYADCNSDGALTIGDFGCFQGKFAAGCP